VKEAIRHIWDLLETGTPQEQEFAQAYLNRWGSVTREDDGWFAADQHWLALAGNAYASRGVSYRESEDIARKMLEIVMKTSAELAD
jgi:hypothetical protein